MPKSLTQPNPLLPDISNGLSKAQIAELVKRSVEAVLEKENLLQMAEVLSVMEEFIKGFRQDERYIDLLRRELIEYQGNVITKAGTRVEICETGIQYDYSHNPGWVELDRQVTELEGKRKELEARLRLIPAGKKIVDTDTGEVFIGPGKCSKSGYKVTLRKG